MAAAAMRRSFDVVIFREVPFDDSWIAAVPSLGIQNVGYLLERECSRGSEGFRGKIPPGQ